MYRLVMTMGIVQVEQNRLRQQEIEVKALIALTNQDVFRDFKHQAIAKLREIAFPELLAEKINQETLWFVIGATNTYQKTADLF